MPSERETLVLICAPHGRDAAVLEQVCREAGWQALGCAGTEELASRAAGGFLLIILTEEACSPAMAGTLREIWHDQPSWSHPPMIVLLDDIERTPPALADLIAELAISTCLRMARPLEMRELLRAIEAQAAFRLRQYETRDLVTSAASEEQRQRFQLRELEHRVSNMLASLTSLLRMTARSAADLEQFASSFGGRLDALARVHHRLSGDGGELSLRQVIEDCLRPYCASLDQIEMAGPEQALTPRTAISLTMMLHELATNAAKYGALSSDQGVVRVSWSVDRDDQAGERLKLVWKELGGPEVAAPAGSGFGTVMLEQLASSKLAGSSTFDFAPDGLRFELEATIG